MHELGSKQITLKHIQLRIHLQDTGYSEWNKAAVAVLSE